jgi:hypothetical protein
VARRRGTSAAMRRTAAVQRRQPVAACLAAFLVVLAVVAPAGGQQIVRPVGAVGEVRCNCCMAASLKFEYVLISKFDRAHALHALTLSVLDRAGSCA